MNYEENFDTLVGYWDEAEKNESPNKLSIYRQKQLKNILDSYGGKAIPIEHFTDRVMNGEILAKSKKCPHCGHGPSENYHSHNLTNFEAFPVVYAYLCGVLVRNEHQLELKDDIELGLSPIPCTGSALTEQ